MNVQAVLINSSQDSTSGILFGEKYVLTTNRILGQSQRKVYNCKESVLQKFSNNITYTVLTKINSYSAKLTHCFNCKYVKDFVNKEASSWELSSDNEKQNFLENLSTFLIFEIENGLDCDKTLEESLFELYELSIINNQFVSVGEEVFVKATPFGLKNFINSKSVNTVSNIFGTDDSLMLIDYPGVPGSEGGLIYKKLNPIGIILCCIQSWKNSSVGLVVAIKLNSLLSNIVTRPQILKKLKEIIQRPIMDDCLAQIFSGSSWGTAVLINKEKGYFLTASHVIDSKNIYLYWKEQQFEIELIYSTPPEKVFDLAILKAKSDKFYQSKMKEASIANYKIKKGEIVYAAGYTLFNKVHNPQPIYTKGVVSLSKNSILHTTCTILAGMSGGALFNRDFKLIGIIIANLKLEDVTYPKINMVIPMSCIFNTLEKFLLYEDASYLSALENESDTNMKEWNICKL